MKRLALFFMMMSLACTLMAVNAQAARFETHVGVISHLTVVDDVDVDVRYVPDSAGTVVLWGTQEQSDNIILSPNNKGKLMVQVSTDAVLKGEQMPQVTIYAGPQLLVVENAGDSTLTLHLAGMQQAPKFKVRLSDNGKVIVHNALAQQLELHILTGKGKIIADGQCDKLMLKLIGIGEIQADKVNANNVECRITGTGNIGCLVNGGKLTVRGSGTGKVYYKGNPSKVTVRKLGTIKAIHVE